MTAYITKPVTAMREPGSMKQADAAKCSLAGGISAEPPRTRGSLPPLSVGVGKGPVMTPIWIEQDITSSCPKDSVYRLGTRQFSCRLPVQGARELGGRRRCSRRSMSCCTASRETGMKNVVETTGITDCSADPPRPLAAARLSTVCCHFTRSEAKGWAAGPQRETWTADINTRESDRFLR